mgnify:FL=1
MVASLEQVSRRVQGSLKVAGIAGGHALHQPSERYLCYPGHHVQVIAHPAIGMDTHFGLAGCFGDDFLESIAISITVEDLLAMIAPQRDVVKAARKMLSRSPGHVGPVSA